MESRQGKIVLAVIAPRAAPHRVAWSGRNRASKPLATEKPHGAERVAPQKPRHNPETNDVRIASDLISHAES